MSKPAENPYASMEKDQLISLIHFLVKREEERTQENQELKDMVKELRDTHKQDVKTQAGLMKTQANLLKSIDRLTNQVADLTTQNKSLQKKVNDLLSQISVGNKVRFGSKSQKGIRNNAAPVVDREKDKGDFDGTNGASMNSVSRADTAPVADTDAAEKPQKNYENRKGMKNQTMYADRQGERTSKIIKQLRQRLDKLLADGNPTRGYLMQKALNYLKSFWNQLMLYLKDGRYKIDRSSSAGLLPTGRKNLLPMTIGIKK